MRQIKITFRPLDDGRKGVALGTPCPNGRNCMVGSGECARCKGFAMRKSKANQYVACKIDKPFKTLNL